MSYRANANGNGTAGPGRNDERKLFVGGLHRNTGEKEISEYFSQFGEVESISIKNDPYTGQSRGFAFVTFTTQKAIDDLLAAGDHYIANKKIDPKRVTKRVNPLKCKIFVGGLTTEITEQDVRDYFSQYGTITEFQQPFDKTKNMKKGFCFISFDDQNVADQILANPKQVICGKEIDVKRVKFNPETMGSVSGAVRGAGARVAGASAAYAAAPGGRVVAYPSTYAGYATPDYGYTAGSYDAYATAYPGYDYSAMGYAAYPAAATSYGGGKYRDAAYTRHAPY
uniref:RNA-binding protein squid n=1 Tax=Cacopsylla melanoneura TaxID=428564 RepID=A0A8D8RZ29_9HEMI